MGMGTQYTEIYNTGRDPGFYSQYYKKLNKTKQNNITIMMLRTSSCQKVYAFSNLEQFMSEQIQYFPQRLEEK